MCAENRGFFSMFEDVIRVPEERLAVLIGKKGVVRREIEKKTNTALNVDTEENEVVVSGEDNLDVLVSCSIVKAVGRGFNPKIAMLLCKEDYCLEMIDITDFVGKSKKNLIRLKSRLIGRDGKAWKTIEKFSNVKMAVYGKTVCLIGKIDDVFVAKRAIEDLLKGAPHGRIYKWIIEKKKKERLG